MTTKIEKQIKEAHSKFNSINDFIRFGVSLFNQNDLFYGHGTTNVYDEVVYLILFSLNLPLDKLEPYLNATLLESEKTLILDRFKQRVIDKLPAAYITNHSQIQNYAFYVDQRAIIPRSFIPEILLNDDLLPWINELENVDAILDLCTGNGSIAIIASDYFAPAQVIAADISSEALEVARINVNNYQLQQQIQLIHSDLWTNIPALKFDVIFSNPPYVDKHRMDNIKNEYLHEPQIALYGGDSGLDLVIEIINKARLFLKNNGLLVVEMGDNQNELEALFPNLPFMWLNTASGDGFVFLLTKNQLDTYFNA
ncbi:MAG: 50S ribosomal protein L3 N(5)-glutamine methyltransferase [Burkholderiales bacterium]|nr:50S ribosomal protein L3 N(5)-glutamine methyltransferase [Burkholderiales bacterium]